MPVASWGLARGLLWFPCPAVTPSQLSSSLLLGAAPRAEGGWDVGKIFQHWWVHFGGLELGMDSISIQLPWVWAAPWTLMNNGDGHSKTAILSVGRDL